LKRLGIICMFLFPVVGLAQNLESIGETSPVKFTGGLSVNQIFYAADEISNRRDPYNYFLGANVNIDIYGLSLPFSFTYSNQESSFRQPFNQFSLSPTYKWVTGHFGYTSMNFSPYSLNGHIFEGAGLDLKPSDLWEINVMYGRLQRAVQPDTSQQDEVLPVYKRRGYGLKVKYGTSSDFIALSLFRSMDDIGSLSNIDEASGVLPEENLVTSINFSKQLIKKISIKGAYAISMLTRDLQSPEAPSSDGLANLLYNYRTSTSIYDAYNAEINFTEKKYGFGLRYEKVGADYETHGAYYFNNNFNNLTFQSNFKLLRGRANTQVRFGVQSDNIHDNKMSATQRWVGSVNFNYRPTNTTELSADYSNFTTYTNVDRSFLDLSYLSPYDRLDTLNYSQVAQQANLMVNHKIGKSTEVQKGLMFRINFMESHDTQAQITQLESSIFYTVSGGYRQSVKATNFSFNALLNLQYNNYVTNQTVVLGPSIMLSKLFFERSLRTTAGLAYNHVKNTSFEDSEAPNSDGRTFNMRLGANYKLAKQHAFNLSLITVSRSKNVPEKTQNLEFTGTLGYNFNF
jgi:hypothetical protein